MFRMNGYTGQNIAFYTVEHGARIRELEREREREIESREKYRSLFLLPDHWSY